MRKHLAERECLVGGKMRAIVNEYVQRPDITPHFRPEISVALIPMMISTPSLAYERQAGSMSTPKIMEFGPK